MSEVDQIEKDPNYKKPPKIREGEFRPTDKGLLIGTKNAEGKVVAVNVTDSPVEVVGYVRPVEDDNSHGLLVQLGTREYVVPRDELATPSKLSTWLLKHGVLYNPSRWANEKLMAYFHTWNGDRLNGYHRNGWHADVHVAGATVTGDPKGVSIGKRATHFESRNSFSGWEQHVKPWAYKKPGWMFALAVALSSPVLQRAGAANGGCFHMYGETSRGKTDGAWLAAGCWGHPNPRDPKGVIFEYSSPSNVAPEIIMGSSADCFACFDEIKKPDDRDTKRQNLFMGFAYMAANGQSVPRGRSTGEELTDRRKWLLNVLTISEYSMASLLGSTRLPGGASVRLQDIDADPLFPDDCMLTDEELTQFHKDVSSYYGTAGPEMARRLVSMDVEAMFYQAKRDLYDGTDTRIQRIATMFASLVVACRVMDLPTDVVFDVFRRMAADGTMDRRANDNWQMADRMRSYIEENLRTGRIAAVTSGWDDAEMMEGHSSTGRDGWVLMDDDGNIEGLYLRSDVIKERFMVRSLRATYAYLEEHGITPPTKNGTGGRVIRLPGLPRLMGVPIDLDALRELTREW